MGICPAKVDECPENYMNTEKKQSVVSNGMVIRYFQWLVPYTSWMLHDHHGLATYYKLLRLLFMAGHTIKTLYPILTLYIHKL